MISKQNKILIGVASLLGLTALAVWASKLSEGQGPPPINECENGQTRTQICSNGSTITTHTCINNNWVETDEFCDLPPPPPPTECPPGEVFDPFIQKCVPNQPFVVEWISGQINTIQLEDGGFVGFGTCAAKNPAREKRKVSFRIRDASFRPIPGYSGFKIFATQNCTSAGFGIGGKNAQFAPNKVLAARLPNSDINGVIETEIVVARNFSRDLMFSIVDTNTDIVWLDGLAQIKGLTSGPFGCLKIQDLTVERLSTWSWSGGC